MKKLLVLAAVLAAAFSVTATGAVADNIADHSLRLDRQSIRPTVCSVPGSTMVVGVSYTLLDDADSGFGGNAWANDTIYRTLKIWQEPDSSYCAAVSDIGLFVTYAGTSPSGTSTVSAGVVGVISGGYIATFTGTPNASPGYATHGFLGAFDLQCDQSFNCPGAHPSFLSYFDVPTYNEPAWGWIYRTSRHGTWVNQAGGSSGDITG